MSNLTKTGTFDQLDDLFNRYFSLRGGWPTKQKDENNELTLPDWTPSVDISEDESSYKVKAELPGVKREDVNVTLDNGCLTIRGEKHHEKESKDKKTHRIESSYGSFVRSFSIPKEVKIDSVEASYKDGVLNLVIPKSEEAKPKSIEIKIK